MSYAILALKVAGSIGSIAVVGGGSYAAYANRTSIKNYFSGPSPQSTPSTENKPVGETLKTTTPEQTPTTDYQQPVDVTSKLVEDERGATPEETLINNTPINVEIIDSAPETKTHVVLVRYRGSEPATETTLPTDGTLSCTTDSMGTREPCKIYKFANPQLENVVSSMELSSLVEATNTNDFSANNYFVIELTGTPKTSTQLQNKTFTLKDNTKDLGQFDFDQMLTGESAKTSEITEASKEWYLVKKSIDWKVTDTSSSYRCKLLGNVSTNKLDNYDSSCKLVAIVPNGSDKIITTTQLKALNTPLTTTALKTSTDTYYKLIVNKNSLYNLDFSETSSESIEVQLANDTNTIIGTVEIQQKFASESFIGKTSWLLARVINKEENIEPPLITPRCSFNQDVAPPIDERFECDFFGSSNDSKDPINKQEFDDEKVDESNGFDVYEYFAIYLKTPKNITELTKHQNIYYHKMETTRGNSCIKVELSIIALMSGDFKGTQQKPTLISEPLNTEII